VSKGSEKQGSSTTHFEINVLQGVEYRYEIGVHIE
jgi:hypothetical protein